MVLRRRVESLIDFQGKVAQVVKVVGFECVFRTKPATDSGRKRPLIPIDSGHPFRRKAATL